jgi:segregation and condensation protein A
MSPMSEPETTAASHPRARGRFGIDVAGFSGSLEELVLAAQRGDVELHDLRVAEVTGQVSRQLSGPELGGDLRDAAEALSLLARLVALKAARITDTAASEADVDEEAPIESDAGRRLAEYRLYKAAADALLADAAEAGARSFLGIVSADVLPLERLRIPPERLAAAFRAVLERLQESPPIPVGAVTFSVEEKVGWIRQLLASGPIAFEEIFAGVVSRLEAVACFLALLELLKRGEASVDQDSPFGPIRVTVDG